MGGIVRRMIGAAMVAALLVGCGGVGGGSDSGAVPDPNQLTKEQLKERLNYIAENGQTGSALSGMYEQISQTGDKALLADYKKLEAARSPEQAKKIAQQMASKL